VSSTSGSATRTAPATSAELLGRLDRLPRHAVGWAATGIVGLGLFVVFYCNFNINVSFIQTCTQIRPGCTPENAASSERLPVVLYLVGYVLGGLTVAPLSDRFGRKKLVFSVLLFAIVGSLITALAGGYGVFTFGRLVTGVAMGGLLAVGNTYIGELAPPSSRARYTAITFVLCTAGAMIGIFGGLLFTTESASFPNGLPFAFAGESFMHGWRWIYVIAVVVGVVAALAALRLPESPRWLLEHGRNAEAETVVEQLEKRALRRGPLAEPPVAPAPLEEHEKTSEAYRELFANRRYRRRTAVLVLMWFFGYATVFSFSTSSTSILTGLHFTPPVAGMITAVGGIGFFVQGLFSAKWSEILPRHIWLPIGAVLTLLGGVIVAELGTHITWAFIGMFVIFFGFNVWVPPTFALSAESFPTRIRSAGFGLVDGLGVTGGMVGVLVIAPLVPHLSALWAFVLVCSFQIVAAIIAQFAPRARNESLEVLSP
jgi:MFS transporter, putative metabolite:H+ symporter